MTKTETETQERTTTMTKKIRRTLFGTKPRKVAAIGLALLAIPGSAMAAWMLTSHGQGAAKVGSFATPTVTAGTPSGSVLPGGVTSASFRVDNGSNDAPLEVYAIQDGDGSGTSTVGLCDAQNLVVQPSTLTTPIRVEAGQTTNVVIPDAFRLLGGAPVECAGATLSVDAVLKFRTVA